MKKNFLFIVVAFITINLLHGGAYYDYYKPAVNNLRLREEAGLNGKFIKFLKESDKFIILEEGRKEIVDNISGSWILVFTKSGDLGWIFSGYVVKTDGVYTSEDQVLQNNSSGVYFSSSGNNSGTDTIIGENSYLIRGCVRPRATKLEVSYENKIIYSQEYKDSKTLHYFLIKLSADRNEIKAGINNYKFKVYPVRNEWDERDYELTLIPTKSEIIKKNQVNWFKYKKLKKENYDLYSINLFYSESPYFDFNKYIINLENGFDIELSVVNKKAENMYAMPVLYSVKNSEKGIDSNIELYIGDFMGFMDTPVYLKHYKNGDILFETSCGHEGVSDYVYFSFNKKKIFRLSNYLKIILKNDYYPVIIADIDNEVLTIDEFPYCCDEIPNPSGFEKITIDLNNDIILKREKKKSPNSIKLFSE